MFDFPRPRIGVKSHSTLTAQLRQRSGKIAPKEKAPGRLNRRGLKCCPNIRFGGLSGAALSSTTLDQETHSLRLQTGNVARFARTVIFLHQRNFA
jgi:hypothetical protein